MSVFFNHFPPKLCSNIRWLTAAESPQCMPLRLNKSSFKWFCQGPTGGSVKPEPKDKWEVEWTQWSNSGRCSSSSPFQLYLWTVLWLNRPTGCNHHSQRPPLWTVPYYETQRGGFSLFFSVLFLTDVQSKNAAFGINSPGPDRQRAHYRLILL